MAALRPNDVTANILNSAHTEFGEKCTVNYHCVTSFFFPGRDQHYEVDWLVLFSLEHPKAQPSRRLFLLLF